MQTGAQIVEDVTFSCLRFLKTINVENDRFYILFGSGEPQDEDQGGPKMSQEGAKRGTPTTHRSQDGPRGRRGGS